MKKPLQNFTPNRSRRLDEFKKIIRAYKHVVHGDNLRDVAP